MGQKGVLELRVVQQSHHYIDPLLSIVIWFTAERSGGFQGDHFLLGKARKRCDRNVSVSPSFESHLRDEGAILLVETRKHQWVQEVEENISSRSTVVVSKG
jgi:hypothetical protein